MSIIRQIQSEGVEIEEAKDGITVFSVKGEAKESLAKFLACRRYHLDEQSNPDVPFDHLRASSKQLQESFSDFIRSHLLDFGVQGTNPGVYFRDDGTMDVYFHYSYHEPEQPFEYKLVEYKLVIEIKCWFYDDPKRFRTQVLFREGRRKIVEDLLKIHYALMAEPEIKLGYTEVQYPHSRASLCLYLAPSIYLGLVLKDFSFIFAKIKETERSLGEYLNLQFKTDTPIAIRENAEKEYICVLIDSLGVKLFE